MNIDQTKADRLIEIVKLQQDGFNTPRLRNEKRILKCDLKVPEGADILTTVKIQHDPN